MLRVCMDYEGAVETFITYENYPSDLQQGDTMNGRARVCGSAVLRAISARLESGSMLAEDSEHFASISEMCREQKNADRMVLLSMGDKVVFGIDMKRFKRSKNADSVCDSLLVHPSKLREVASPCVLAPASIRLPPAC